MQEKRIQSINLEGPRETFLWLGFLLSLLGDYHVAPFKEVTFISSLLPGRAAHVPALGWGSDIPVQHQPQLWGAEEPEGKADEPAVTMWNACCKKPNSTEHRNHGQVFTFATLVLCVVLDAPTAFRNFEIDWSGWIQFIPKKISAHLLLTWQCCLGKITLGREFKALFLSLK